MTEYKVIEKHRVVYEKQEPTYYSKMPKMALEELTPYELALYANYKQTASENGAAFKSNKTLSKECKMSIRMIQECRKSLETKGFIHCTYESNEQGVVTSSVIVQIVDIWELNHKRYSKKDPMQVVHTPHAHDAHPHAGGAPKEELNNKEPKKEKDIAPKVASNGKALPKEKKPAEYLADAMGIALVKADWSNYTKVAKTLNDSGVSCDEFIGYVLEVKKQAAAQKWELSVNSLVSNGRVSKYITQRDAYKVAPKHHSTNNSQDLTAQAMHEILKGQKS